MKTISQKASEALELLPEDMREPAVAYLIEQAEKFSVLKSAVADGLEDVRAGKVTEWNMKEFLTTARATSTK